MLIEWEALEYLHMRLKPLCPMPSISWRGIIPNSSIIFHLGLGLFWVWKMACSMWPHDRQYLMTDLRKSIKRHNFNPLLRTLPHSVRSSWVPHLLHQTRSPAWLCWWWWSPSAVGWSPPVCCPPWGSRWWTESGHQSARCHTCTHTTIGNQLITKKSHTETERQLSASTAYPAMQFSQAVQGDKQAPNLSSGTSMPALFAVAIRKSTSNYL